MTSRTPNAGDKYTWPDHVIEVTSVEHGLVLFREQGGRDPWTRNRLSVAQFQERIATLAWGKS